MEGQLKLARAKVLMIGAGGLGAPLGLYLAAAGVGRLGIVDFDAVDFTNLQRQITFTTQDVGRPKTEAAQERLSAMNPHDSDRHVPDAADQRECARAVSRLRHHRGRHGQFSRRAYLVNDACVLLGKPNVYGSIFRFEGQATVFSYPGRAVLPLPVSGTAAAGTGAVVRRRRRAGRAAGHRRARFRPWRRSS